jgi:hypothetical protein
MKLRARITAMSGPSMIFTVRTLKPKMAIMIASNPIKMNIAALILFFISTDVLKKERKSNIKGASSKLSRIPRD